MSEVSIELSKFIDDFISKNGNDADKKIWEKKGKKWFMVFVDSKIINEEAKNTTPKASTPKASTPKAASPKRVMTPYNLYVKKQFPIVRKECPYMSPQNVMKEIGKKWTKSKTNDEIKSKTLDEPAEEVGDNSSLKNHTFFVFELFNSLFNVK